MEILPLNTAQLMVSYVEETRMKFKANSIALAVLLSLASTSVIADDRWEKEAKDAWIDGKAESMLLFNTKINSFDINTDVRDGVVILTGKVESEYEKQLATELIKSLDGVKGVDNKLTVIKEKDEWMKDYMARRKEEVKEYAERKKEEAEDYAERKKDEMEDAVDDWDESDFAMELTDAKIASVLGTKMLFEDDLDSWNIDVEVEDGVVMLMGHVPNDTHKALAEEMAKNTDDVKKVKNYLKIKP